MYQVTVFSSGGGGNFKSILRQSYATFQFKVNSLVTDRECGAILFADIFGIKSHMLRRNSVEDYLDIIPKETDLLVLAGFMPIIPKDICDLFEGKIINTHPSLLPKFGGKGMYGVRVHEAVLNAGENVTGCTVHYVTDEVDKGPIIKQSKIIIPKNITPWELGGLVHGLEVDLLPKVILDLSAKII